MDVECDDVMVVVCECGCVFVVCECCDVGVVGW